MTCVEDNLQREAYRFPEGDSDIFIYIMLFDMASTLMNDWVRCG